MTTPRNWKFTQVLENANPKYTNSAWVAELAQPLEVSHPNSLLAEWNLTHWEAIQTFRREIILAHLLQ